MSGSNLTKVQQETIVGEGLAVALLALGVDGLTSNRQAIQSAFQTAWRGWSCQQRFPQIRAELARNEIESIIDRSPRRRGGGVAEWTSDGPWYAPLVRNDDSVENAGYAIADNSGLDFGRWMELAQAMLANLAADAIRRPGA